MTPPLMPIFADIDGGMAETVMPSLPSPASASCGAVGIVRLAGDIGVGLGAITDDDIGSVLLAVAKVTEFHS